ncbi:dipicolinic acid synthetase subunit A [Alkalihalobacillus pseudalcaliphilus]|uniref:dipicolinic acid synthetase subunit A n=1 Tax=Alkalihalobacillus pseudalcaliphilus TaxID=79884 RepID=UPI00064E02B3|nr:dipicolinic acid synthetase subunit A [Alkalihalobacillus pseudalcaliphilus]KMK77265.1 dipicolinate synthase subunit A [Alkalihalobacillus pseudalcaliphilus]
MLEGKHIVIIGGDARQLEIIRKLSRLQAKLSLVGFQQLDDGFIGASKEGIDDINWSNVDAVILPVSGTDAHGSVETVFSNEKVILNRKHLQQSPKHCVIYSGISNEYLTDITKKANRKLVKLMDRDDIAIYNSIPTAEGALMIAIQHTDITLHNADIIVLGLGRTGMTIARTFSAIGAKVKVAVREADLLARATEMGLKAIPISDLEQHSEACDLFINTIPALVLTEKVLAKIPTHSLIIDLASKPGGTDFDYAEKRGIRAQLVPGLPGIVAPKTAGIILANVLTELILEQ